MAALAAQEMFPLLEIYPPAASLDGALNSLPLGDGGDVLRSIRGRRCSRSKLGQAEKPSHLKLVYIMLPPFTWISIRSGFFLGTPVEAWDWYERSIAALPYLQ